MAKSQLVTQSDLMQKFKVADAVRLAAAVDRADVLKLDLVRAVSWPMIPFILIFLFMVLFDTLGTLIGVAEQAGLIKDNKLPRANRR